MYKMRLIEKKVRDLYKGFNSAYLFSFIRFFVAPLKEIEQKLPQKGCIVDLGCGYGIFTNYAAMCGGKRRLIGIDLDAGKINYARKGIKNAEYIIADITKHKIEKCDIIIAMHVLHHLSSYKAQEKLIKRCAELLNKNGKFIVNEVASAPLWKLIMARLADYILYPRDKILYRKENEMKELLSKYFGDVKIEYYSEYFPFPQVVYTACKI